MTMPAEIRQLFVDERSGTIYVRGLCVPWFSV